MCQLGNGSSEHLYRGGPQAEWVEWTDDLVAGKWTVLTNEAIAGTGAIIKVIDAGAGTQKQGFYRVVETQTASMKKP